MREIAFVQICNFRPRRAAAKNLIAMGMTAERRDHLLHVAGLLHQRPVNRLQVCGGFCGDFFAKPDEEIEALKVIGSLAMAEWQTMHDLEPWRWQRGVVAVRQSLDRQRQRRRVLRECPGASPPDRARELIEHDDEREPAFGIGGPVAEISCGSLSREFRKAGLNFAVRAATHSPEPVISMDLRVYL